MSQSIAPRLPYDDATSPHELYPDCEAAGAALGLALTPTAGPARPVGVGAAEALDGTEIAVPRRAAVLAGSLHLHLN